MDKDSSTAGVREKSSPCYSAGTSIRDSNLPCSLVLQRDETIIVSSKTAS
jgi:hypothetical protein